MRNFVIHVQGPVIHYDLRSFSKLQRISLFTISFNKTPTLADLGLERFRNDAALGRKDQY